MDEPTHVGAALVSEYLLDGLARFLDLGELCDDAESFDAAAPCEGAKEAFEG
ncbi:hypothetical protein ACWEJ6_49580 [Nonomuraea sp. NPDC004702]